MPDSDLIGFILRAVKSGIDLIQIREKDLNDRQLLELSRKIVNAAEGISTHILLNDRLDIALAAGVAGVHLGSHTAPIEVVRQHAPQGFLIGASTHSLEEAVTAEEGGADFIVFGPVFYTPSKAKYGKPVGVEALKAVCARISIPVFPLGGIQSENFGKLLDIPIAGIAGISMFQNAVDLEKIVRMIQNGKIRS